MASTTTAPHPVRPIVLLGAAAVAMVVVVVTSVAAADGRVGPVERSLFEAVNGLRDGLLVPRWVPQLAGVTGTAVVVALVAVWRRWLLAGALVLLVPGKLLAARAVPTMPVHRERPGVTVPGAVLRDAAAAGLSFPSRHAIIASGIATLLTPYLGRRWRIAVWTLAVLTTSPASTSARTTRWTSPAGRPSGCSSAAHRPGSSRAERIDFVKS